MKECTFKPSLRKPKGKLAKAKSRVKIDMALIESTSGSGAIQNESAASFIQGGKVVQPTQVRVTRDFKTNDARAGALKQLLIPAFGFSHPRR